VIRTVIVAALLAAAPALAPDPAHAQDPGRPAVGPAPIHPNDLNSSNSQQRIDEIRRSGNPGDYGQMNALDALRQQSDSMNEGARRSGEPTTLAPIPPERREVPPRAVPDSPGGWPGYRPGYLPRQ